MPSIALSNLATFLKHGANSCNMIWEEYVTLFCQISLIAEADVVFYAGKKIKSAQIIKSYWSHCYCLCLKVITEHSLREQTTVCNKFATMLQSFQHCCSEN